MSQKSTVWEKFTKSGKSGSDIATCNICKKALKCAGGSTSGLWTHLNSCHGGDVPTKRKAVDKDDEDLPPVKKQQSIMAFVEKESLGSIYGKMAAVSGFSIYAMTHDAFIQKSLRLQNFNPPKDHKTVASHIQNFAAKIKEKMKKEFVGKRLSLTLDEYTTMKNQRLMNVNVHENEHFRNLGMVRIHGSLDADMARQLVQTKLTEFGISFDQLVCATTDGAAIMVKLGKNLPCLHQQCLAHGLHLAVCDVIYAKTSKPDPVDELSEIEVDSNERDDDNSEDETVPFYLEEEEGIPNNLIPAVQSGLEKIRKIIRKFRKSPVKNDFLQKKLQEIYGKEKELVLDVKTRWNSLITMVKRYLEVADTVAIVCNEFGIENALGEDELSSLQDVVSILEPIEIALKKICARDSTLLTAHFAFKFIVAKLDGNFTDLGRKMKEAVITRYKERLNLPTLALFRYLKSPESLGQDDQLMSFPSKSVLIRTAKEILIRLYPANKVNDKIVSPSTSTEVMIPVEQNEMSLQQELDQVIEESAAGHESFEDDYKSLSKEMILFEATGKRTQNLVSVMEALETIPPTSVECERAFSAAGCFVTKRRSRMNSQTIDTLCFLKSYFLNEK